MGSDIFTFRSVPAHPQVGWRTSRGALSKRAVFAWIMKASDLLHAPAKTMNELHVNIATAVATVATALFTGFTAYIMHKERTQRRTPEVKVRVDTSDAERGIFRVSLFFTPGGADFPIKAIRVKGCMVSQRFTHAQFGMPPLDSEPPSWRASVLVEKAIFSEPNSLAFKADKSIEPLAPVISFWIRPLKPIKLLRVYVNPPLFERLSLRSERIVKSVYLDGPIG